MATTNKRFLAVKDGDKYKLAMKDGKYLELDIASSGGGIPWLTDAGFANVQEFANTAEDYEMVKYNVLPNGDSVDMVVYVKTPAGLREFRTYEDLMSAIQVVEGELQKQIDINFQDIALSNGKIATLETEMTTKVQLTGSGGALPSGVKRAYDVVKGDDGHVYPVTPLFTEAEWTKNVNDTMEAKDNADKNKADITALKASSGGVWRDITSTWKTRVWNDNDMGKNLRIEYDHFGIMQSMVVPINYKDDAGYHAVTVSFYEMIRDEATHSWALNLATHTLSVATGDPSGIETSAIRKVEIFEPEPAAPATKRSVV